MGCGDPARYDEGVSLNDTAPDAAQRQLDLVRAATPAERFQVASSLTRTTIALSRRAIRRRNPGAAESEIDRLFAELHYGAELVRRLMGPR